MLAVIIMELKQYTPIIIIIIGLTTLGNEARMCDTNTQSQQYTNKWQKRRLVN